MTKAQVNGLGFIALNPVPPSSTDPAPTCLPKTHRLAIARSLHGEVWDLQVGAK